MIPQLRFPGFTDEWRVKTLGDVAEIIDGDRGVNYPKQAEFAVTGYCLFLNAGNVTKQGFNFDDTAFISRQRDELLNKGKLVRNDIILTTRGSIGHIAFYSDDIPHNNIRINSGMVIVRLKDEVTPLYIYRQFASPKLTKHIKTIAFGSAQPQLTVRDIKKFNVSVPSQKEQEKIAEFLTVVDERIGKSEKKLELLKQYKKGVMQKIFTQQIRFKDEDGKDYPDWEKKAIGECAFITMGQSPDSRAYNNDGDGVYLIQGNADIKGRKTAPRLWTSQITKTCKVGDIILTVRAPSGFVAISEHEACMGRGVCSVIPKNNTEKNFIFQFLLWFEPKWGNIEQGSTFTAISGDDIRSVRLNLPSREEQQKIADLLTSLDDKIKAEETRLSAAKQWKKGLLQRMFA